MPAELIVRCWWRVALVPVAIDAVPEQLRKRALAVRAFDGQGMMVAFELVDGRELEGAIEQLLARPDAEHLHVHFAAPGCYAARVERV